MSLLRSSLVVGLWTFLSRILGFLRDVAIANKLGAGAASDVLFIALTLPNLFRRLLGEGAFNVAFVPLFTRINSEQGEAAAQRFTASVLGGLILLLITITVVGLLFMPAIVMLIAPGFAADSAKFDLAVLLGRLTFPYLMFMTLASLFGALCNIKGNFAAYAAVPSLLNIAMLAGLFLLPPFGVEPVMAAAVAVPVGGVLQLVVMFYALKKTGFKIGVTWNANTPDMHKLLLRMGPAALGIGVLQISFIIDNVCASLLGDAAISYLQYANRFYQLPLALIGIAMATVLLPHFSAALRVGDKKQAADSFLHSLTAGLTLALAATVGLVFLASELTSALFGHGKFTPEDAAATSAAMIAYSLGLTGYVLTKITATAFYAHEDTKTPVKAAVIALCVNAVGNIVLMQFWGHVGIALATAMSGWTNAFVQLYWMQKKGHMDVRLTSLTRPLLLTFALSAAMAAGLWGFEALWAYPHDFVPRLIWLALACGIGAGIFFAGAQLTGLFPVKDILRALKKRRAAV